MPQLPLVQSITRGPKGGEPSPPARRVGSVDALRGLVMIIMALDHVREFHHAGAMLFQPDDLTRTTPWLFLTRWITHFCAPVFMLTAGLAAFYWMRRGHTPAQLTTFLAKRGLWLILIDLVLMRLIMFFGLSSGPVILNVLWALGWCMIALALLAHLPSRILAALSIAMILLHNWADSIPAIAFGGAAWVWNLIHQQGMFRLGPVMVISAYPLVPWVAVMAAGFCFGRIMVLEPERQRAWTFRIGLALTIGFLLLRGINAYGDPQKWSVQASGTMTVLSFLRCNKYPPSLDFLLMTLGPALLLLSWFSRLSFSERNPLIVFGRTPLFFFVIHFLIAHLLTIPIALVRYGRADFLWQPLPSMGGSAATYPAGYGLDLGAVYVVWVAVVILMCPLCLWFRGVKERKSWGWVAYC
jgi:uncharacterized membrane protein